jgi:magnesium transporter
MRLYDAKGVGAELTAAKQKSPAAAVTAAARAGGFLWVGLTNPSEKLMVEVGKTFDLHPLAVADAASGKQQPKVQNYTQHLFVVMWALMYKKATQDIEIGETFIFAKAGLILTVERHDPHFTVNMKDVFDKPVEPLTGGVMSAVYETMANISRGYTEVSSAIEKELEELETQVFDESVDDEPQRIYALRKKIGKVNRAVSGIAVALSNASDHFDKLAVGNPSLGEYFRDLVDDLAGTDQLTTDQNSALDGVIATHENSVASQQNKDARKISAFAALLAIPAVIAGLFGMNFKNLPSVSWVYGWELSVVIILALDAWAFISFKRRHWL